MDQEARRSPWSSTRDHGLPKLDDVPNSRPAIWMGLLVAVAVAVCLAWQLWSGPVAPVPQRSGPGSKAISSKALVDDPRTIAQPARREMIPLDTAARPASDAAAPAGLARLRGRVRFGGGAVVPDALVFLDRRETRTDPRGEFAFDTAGLDPEVDLVAVVKGHQPAVLTDVLAIWGKQRDEILDVVLPGPALSIAGVLFDADGSPGAGWMLELCDGAPLSFTEFPPLTAEDFAAGATREHERQVDPSPRAHTPNRQAVAKDGAFRVGGLRAGRTYVLRAWNERTLEDVRSAAIPAGTEGFLFRVPATSRRELVWGHVVDRWGMPIEAVRVRLTMRVHTGMSMTTYQTGQEQTTGADGAFQFTRVPRRDLFLRFTAPHVLSLYREFPADENGANLRIELSAMCALQFESLPGLAVPDTLCALDAAGTYLRMDEEVGPGVTRGGRELELTQGRSGTIRVSDAAVWLLLRKDGAELRRAPISLARVGTLPVRG